MIERHLGKFLSGQPSEADMNVLNMLNAKYVVVGENEVVENRGALGNAWLVDRIVYMLTTPMPRWPLSIASIRLLRQ